MPQLNPTPWFLIWLSSWLIFVFTMPSLLIMFKPLSLPSKTQILNPLNHWHWPWP